MLDGQWKDVHPKRSNTSGFPMVRRKRFFILFAFVVASASSLIFAGYKVRPFSASHADTFPARDSHDHITIAADPYDRPERLRQVFDVDLMRANYVAVLVVVSNDSPDEIQLDGSVIELVGMRREPLRPTPPEEVIRDVFFGDRRRRDGSPPVRVGIPGGVGIGRNPSKDFENARADFLSKEFGKRFIPAHTTAYGFLFYETDQLGAVFVGSRIYVPKVLISRAPDPRQVGRELLFYEVDLKPAIVGR